MVMGGRTQVLPFPLFGIVIDPDGVETKPEPINIKEESESFNAFSIDRECHC